MVSDADGIVALAVELGGHAAEVADGRQRHGDEAEEKLPHAGAAERDVAADDLALLELEVGDGLPRLRQHGLLAGQGGDIALHIGDRVLVRLGVDAGVDGDLLQAGHLVLVRVAAQLHQLGHDVLEVLFPKGGSVTHGDATGFPSRRRIECWLEK